MGLLLKYKNSMYCLAVLDYFVFVLWLISYNLHFLLHPLWILVIRKKMVLHPLWILVIRKKLVLVVTASAHSNHVHNFHLFDVICPPIDLLLFCCTCISMDIKLGL